MLYGRRLQRLDDNRLVKQITAKKKECGGVSTSWRVSVNCC